MLQKDRSPQAQTRLDNLKELINAMGEFDNLTGFLEHVEPRGPPEPMAA